MRMRSMFHSRSPKTDRARRLLFLSTLALLLLPVGCTGASQKDISASMEAFLPLDTFASRAPSASAELTFTQLKLYRALSAGDHAAILECAGSLLAHGEKEAASAKGKILLPSAAFVDTAIWLITHDKGEEAATLAERAAKLMPDDLPLIALHADLLVQQGRDKEAVDLLQGFVERHPGDEKAQAELAFCLLRGGRADDAMRTFASIPESKLTPQMRFAYAQALNAARRFADSEKQLRLAVEAEPQYAEAWQLLALTLEEVDRAQEAMTIYTRLLSMDPSNRSARLFLLRHHLRSGNMEPAVALVRESQEALRFAVAASAILVEEKQIQQAEELLQRLEQLPDMPAELHFYHAAMLYENGGDLSRALQLLARIPADSDEYGKALRMKVRMLCDLNRIDDALLTIEEVRKLYPEDVEPLLLKAELLTHQKKLTEAKKVLQEALDAHPENEIAAFQFAYLHELLGKREEAMRLMEAVLTRFPENAMALNFVGYNLADSDKELDRAYALIQRAVSLEPDADYIVDSMAWVCFKLGRIDEAWAHIQRAVELNRSSRGADPAMLEHYGDISAARRDWESARSGYGEALDIFLKYNLKDDAERVRAKLSNL